MKELLKKIAKKFNIVSECYVNINVTNNLDLLKDKNVVITGGSSGIGYAIAKKIINNGANVIITGADQKKLEKASEELQCKYIQWDISDVTILNEKTNEIDKIFKHRLDCFINCAGIYKDIRYSDCLEEDWDKTFNVNLKGAYFAINAVIKKFFEPSKKGNIILIASNRGVFGDDGPYGISKAGLINYGEGLANKLLSKNIRVNIINPGMTASNINGIKDTDNLHKDFLKGKRVITAQEIAEIACFLASDSSICLTGQIINCDNGESIL